MYHPTVSGDFARDVQAKRRLINETKHELHLKQVKRSLSCHIVFHNLPCGFDKVSRDARTLGAENVCPPTMRSPQNWSKRASLCGFSVRLMHVDTLTAPVVMLKTDKAGLALSSEAQITISLIKSQPSMPLVPHFSYASQTGVSCIHNLEHEQPHFIFPFLFSPLKPFHSLQLQQWHSSKSCSTSLTSIKACGIMASLDQISTTIQH